jgi:hypothetical protein
MERRGIDPNMRRDMVELAHFMSKQDHINKPRK